MDLLAQVREDFGIPLVGVRPTGLGADARAVLFRGLTADGRAYAVKASSAPQPGLAVADFLAEQGVRGVPAPLRTRDGTLLGAGAGAGGGVSVVPWIEGARAIDTGLDAGQWREFGGLLGAVHATAPAPPLVGAEAVLPVERHDPTSEVARARVFPERLVRAAAAGLDDALLGELESLWARRGADVLAVADLAEASAGSAEWDNADRVICHADPHHGNLLIGDTDSGDDGGVWLVDWDDAVLAPREADLIFVVGGVYSFAPITPADVGWFFDGYSPASGFTPSDLDAHRLTYYRSVRALTDFLDFAEVALDRDQPALERADALRIAAGTLSPDGIVALTLSEPGHEH